MAAWYTCENISGESLLLVVEATLAARELSGSKNLYSENSSISSPSVTDMDVREVPISQARYMAVNMPSTLPSQQHTIMLNPPNNVSVL